MDALEQLLGLEGAGVASYFAGFGDCLIGEGFDFESRSRRPPANPVNAMLIKCKLIAVGGITDHVHLLAGLPATLCISDWVKAVKGSSSHFINHHVRPGAFFKWQGSYGVFSVSQSHLDDVATYIRNQATHHHQQSMITAWELPPA